MLYQTTAKLVGLFTLVLTIGSCDWFPLDDLHPPPNPYSNLIAVTAETGPDTTRIALLDFATLEIERYVPSPATQAGFAKIYDYGPRFSPDKSKIAFLSLADTLTGFRATLVVYDLDSDSLTVFSDPNDVSRLIAIRAFVWDASGDALYYSPDRDFGISTRRLRLNKTADMFSTRGQVWEVMSPDSLLIRDNQRFPQKGTLGLIDRAGNPLAPVPFPEEVVSKTAHNSVISTVYDWNPSLQRLAYAYNVSGEGRHVGISDLQGNNFRSFLHPAWQDRQVNRLSWGPDHQLIVSVNSRRREEPSRVYLLDPATGKVQEYIGPSQMPGRRTAEYVDF